MKYTITKLLALTLALLLFPACANKEIQKEKPQYDENQTHAPEEKLTQNGLEYSLLQDGTYAVSYYPYSEVSTDVVIPKRVKGISVTQIWSSAFFMKDHITSVTIPASVTFIQDISFSGCSKLVSVTFEEPENWFVTGYVDNTYTTVEASILKDPATDATYLKDTYRYYKWTCGELPPDATVIDPNAPPSEQPPSQEPEPEPELPRVGETLYDESKKISYLVLENGELEVRYYNGGKQSLQIPASYQGMDIVSIGVNAFLFSSIKTVTFEANSPLKEIQDAAFLGCEQLTTVTVPASVTYIGKHAFDGAVLSNVYFQNPNGWIGTETRGGTTCRSFKSSELSDSANAASLFMDYQIASLYWERR